jgi:hypothetical protein
VTIVAPLPSEQVRADTIRLEQGGEHEVEYAIGRLLLAECVD